MEFNNPYAGPIYKMELLQRWILVHSYIYYELNDSIVSDEMYDSNCKQLYDLMKQNKSKLKETRYCKQFRGFDGSTGFDLIKKCDGELKSIIEQSAYHVLGLRLRGWQ